MQSLLRFDTIYIVETNDNPTKGKENEMDDLVEWIAGYLYNGEEYFRFGNVADLREHFKSEYDTDLTDDEIDAEIEWQQKNGVVERY